MQTVGSELDALEKTCEVILKHALKMKYEIDYHCRQCKVIYIPRSHPFHAMFRLIVAITLRLGFSGFFTLKKGVISSGEFLDTTFK